MPLASLQQESIELQSYHYSQLHEQNRTEQMRREQNRVLFVCKQFNWSFRRHKESKNFRFALSARVYVPLLYGMYILKLFMRVEFQISITFACAVYYLTYTMNIMWYYLPKYMPEIFLRSELRMFLYITYAMSYLLYTCEQYCVSGK